MARTKRIKYDEYMPPLANPLEAVQLTDDGSLLNNTAVQDERPISLADRLGNRLSMAGSRITDALLGVQAAPTDSTGLGNGESVTRKDEITGEDVVYNPSNSSTISENPRVGGLLNDLASGYRENYNNRFSFKNFGDNDIDFDRKKGFGYRLGEGLGTLGRFVDSPLGRFTLAAGLNSALGYNNSLQEGLTAAVGRQQAKARNDLYRQSLEQQGLDTSNIGGNIDDKMYQNYALANYRNRSLDARMQLGMLKDNTSRAKMINSMLTNGMITPAEAMERMAEYGIKIDNLDESNQTKLLPYRQYALQVAPQIAMGNLGVAQGNLALNSAKLQHQIEQDNKPDAKLSASQKDAQSTLSQIGTIRNLVKQNPNATGLQKGYLPGDVLNRVDKNSNNIKTRTAIDALRTKVRHDLTGAQFSPKEAKEYERFLPTNKDNADIINAKLDALEQRYYADFGVSLSGNTGSIKIGKYTVRIK